MTDLILLALQKYDDVSASVSPEYFLNEIERNAKALAYDAGADDYTKFWEEALNDY